MWYLKYIWVRGLKMAQAIAFFSAANNCNGDL